MFTRECIDEIRQSVQNSTGAFSHYRAKELTKNILHFVNTIMALSPRRACVLLLLFLISPQCPLAVKDETKQQDREVLLRSACNGLSDGLRYIKPTADSVVLPVLCSNGFVMLSPSLNLERYLEFLKALRLAPSTTFGVATSCRACVAVAADVAADMQADSSWTPSLDLDGAECPCYKPAASLTYRV